MLRDLLAFVLPSACVVCGRGLAAFCADCRDGTSPVDAVSLGAFEARCAGAYDGALRTGVLALKHGRRDVGVALADLLAGRVRLPAGVVLVPVPTAPVRRRARGFDQAALLARELGRHAGLGVVDAVVRLGTDSQNGRRRAERLRARDRFGLRGGAHVLAGNRVVLVDDVVTTGATLRDVAATLGRAGATVEGAVAVARAFPSPHRPPANRG